MTTGTSTELLFPELLLDVLSSRPRRPALEHGSRVVRRAELLSLVDRLAAGMRDAGLGLGSSVATLTGVTPEGFAVNLAAHALGYQVVGLRPGWSEPQLTSVLGRGVEAVVGDPSTLTPRLLGLAGSAVVLSLGPHPGAADLLAPDNGTCLTGVDARPGDIARVNFTSGSTGLPKGCVRTYRTFSLAHRPDRWAPDLARLVARCERLLVYGSFSMPVMLTFAGRCLATGGTVVLAAGDPLPMLPYVLARHRITGVAMTVPSLTRMLRQLRDDPVDLRCLRALVVSGSPASAGLLAGAADRLGPVVWQGYGQAESGMISLLTPEDIAESPEIALASVGRPLPDVEVSVRDPEGQPVDAGSSGEICVRSPHVMTGYWGDRLGTDEVLGDGWLCTRDLGRIDATGFLQLTGRTRDVIMVNGEVCYAGAIEEVLVRHPDVVQAYVVGLPDEQTGEAVHAFVLPAPGRRPDHDTLATLIRSALTAGHVPKTITVLREVPVASGGKPDKVALTALVPRV